MWLVGLVLLGLFWTAPVEAACSGSGTTWSCTAGTTASEVNTAVSSATDGAVLTFAAGSYNWSGTGVTMGTLTKGVTLICATQGACNLTLGSYNVRWPFGGTSSKLYRFSGFNVVSGGLGSLTNCSGGGCAATTLYNILVDHNTFSGYGADSSIMMWGENTSISNFIYGVIDHNTVNSAGSVHLFQCQNGSTNVPPTIPNLLGTANNLYVEDNTFNITQMTNSGTGAIDGWGGCSVVFRFNTVYNVRVVMHGVEHAWGPANFEVYYNYIEHNNISTADSGYAFYSVGNRMVTEQGSGSMMVFENRFRASTGDQSGDAVVIQHSGGRSRPSGNFCDGTSVIDGNRTPNGSYFGYPCYRAPGRGADLQLYPIYTWRNRWDNTNINQPMTCQEGYNNSIIGNQECVYHVKNNRDYYSAVSINAQTSPTSPFNGTTGMGFGTLANRPTTCTTGPESLDAGKGGVGYWATDQGEWNSSNGSTPDGQLYICSATNAWALYYTPYTYPHPLVGSVPDMTPPAAPTGVTVSKLEH